MGGSVRLVATGLATEVLYLDGVRLEYRLHRAGPHTVLVFHGGHMRAGIALGESVYHAANQTVFVPSRPGYGRSELASGPGPRQFADTIAGACHRLGITGNVTVVGVSAGGPFALAMAARHPELVRSVILVSAVGPLPWPDPLTRTTARFAFHPRVEAATWAATRNLLRLDPPAGLRAMLASLSTLPSGQVLAQLPRDHKVMLVRLFAALRSGQGFVNDLDVLTHPTNDADEVTQPALVVATRTDRSVPVEHAERLHGRLAGSQLVESTAPSHLLWFSPDRARIEEQIRAHLAETRQ
ncbi:alpha/beta hydrolase [Lipingzhangella sp. LS1_29]|uniref:Alpha/beta hydrolase n=1 Tax=Lipingzhangella rawalii TaxID=2055835 RepID=A0ABU2H3L5_9ACTN|nr:alpha/beta hydrolase [Lipingzhangella rawalii]MDS1269439.1 alpha/beta hydrolase [Lipingzhangella rawalii]